jgi:uncharacterized membrane protein YcjF (UPF0283 family)
MTPIPLSGETPMSNPNPQQVVVSSDAIMWGILKAVAVIALIVFSVWIIWWRLNERQHELENAQKMFNEINTTPAVVVPHEYVPNYGPSEAENAAKEKQKDADLQAWVNAYEAKEKAAATQKGKTAK